MNRFVRTILIVFFVFLIVKLSIFAWGIITAEDKVNFSLPKDKNILVIGNSMGETSLNDSILENWTNQCQSGTEYSDFIVPLDKMLNENSQIDTVCIISGKFNLGIWLTKDSSFIDTEVNAYLAKSKYVYLNILDKQYAIDHLSRKYFYLIPFAKNVRFYIPEKFGGYLYLQRHNLFNPNKNWGITEYEQHLNKRGTRIHSLEEIKRTHSIQIKFLKRLIDICHRKKVVCVLLDTPCYHMDKYCDDKGYQQLLATLPDSVRWANYTNFQLPDTSYYGDVHHLNHLGAEFFSRYIKKHGLKSISIAKLKKKSGATSNP